MTQQYQNRERKFTILHLEIRKFDILDQISLALFALSIIGHFVISIYFPEKKILNTYIISWAIAFFVLTTAFGLRFRNVYFSIVWLVLSLLFLIDNYSFSKIPILTFMLYHSVRLIFWRKYHREFIPYELGRRKFLWYFSETEGRRGSKEDRKYSKILLFVGVLIIIYCLFEWVKLNKAVNL